MLHTAAANKAALKMERLIIADATEDDDFKGIQQTNTQGVPIQTSQPTMVENPRNESKRLFLDEEIKKTFLLDVYGSELERNYV